MRYNVIMIRWHGPHLWLVSTLGVILVVAAALWLHGTRSGASSPSALPTPAIAEDSPLPTPALTPPAVSPDSWVTGGAVLVWVALGIVLASGIAMVILRRHRDDPG